VSSLAGQKCSLLRSQPFIVYTYFQITWAIQSDTIVLHLLSCPSSHDTSIIYVYGRKHHAHLVGYARVTKALPPAHYASTVARDDSLAAQASTVAYDDNSRARESVLFDMSSNGESSKRRNSCSVIHWRAQKRQHINDYANQPPDVNAVQMQDERIRHLICQKKVLKDECSKLEASEQQLLCKVCITYFFSCLEVCSL
jgi:hypothetical protein